MNIKKIMFLSLFMVNAGYIHGMEDASDNNFLIQTTSIGRPRQETIEQCAYYLQKEDLKTKARFTGTAATLLGALTAGSFYMLEGTDRKLCSSILASASLYLLYNTFKSYRLYKEASLECKKDLENNNLENENTNPESENTKKLIQATLNGTLKLGSIGNGHNFYFQNSEGKIYPSHRWVLNDSGEYERKPWIDNTPFAKFLS